MKTLPLSAYLKKRTFRSRMLLILSTATILALGITLVWTGVMIHFTGMLDRTVSPYVASVLEPVDQTELQRLVKSMVDQTVRQTFVVQDGYIMASAGGPTLLGLPYSPDAIRWVTGRIGFGEDGILIRTTVRRPHGPALNAQIYTYVPYQPVVSLMPLLFVVAFVLIYTIASLLQHGLLGATDRALKPVRELAAAIRDSDALTRLYSIPETGIQEMETIRAAGIDGAQAAIERKDAQAQAKAQELATRSYRKMIHDLHNPALALRTWGKVFEQDDLSQEEHARAGREIVELSQRLLRQMSAAKANLSFEHPNLEDADLRTTVQKTVEMIQAANERTDVNVKTELPTAPFVCKHDPVLLGRAVANVVSNAVEACRSTVLVELVRSEEGVGIRVSDDGPGLSLHEVETYLVGGGVSTKGKRAALGLASANHIAQKHGGRIVYAQSMWGGASFEVRI